MLGEHVRYGHCSPYVLKKTLEERGIEVTEKECEVPCLRCEEGNAVLKKIPARKEKDVSHRRVTQFGEEVQHDLSQFKWRERSWEISVMKDVGTGWLDLKMITFKGDAITHLEEWTEENGAPRKVATDNGGEFVGGRYQGFFERHRGKSRHHRGPARTPEHQGKVERSNRTWKSVLYKVLRELVLPGELLGEALKGVCNQINSRWSRVIGMSPRRARYGIHPVSAGDTPDSGRYGQRPASAGDTLDPGRTLQLNDVVIAVERDGMTKKEAKGELGIVLNQIEMKVTLVHKREGGWVRRTYHPIRIKRVKPELVTQARQEVLQGRRGEINSNVRDCVFNFSFLKSCVKDENKKIEKKVRFNLEEDSGSPPTGEGVRPPRGGEEIENLDKSEKEDKTDEREICGSEISDNDSESCDDHMPCPDEVDQGVYEREEQNNVESQVRRSERLKKNRKENFLDRDIALDMQVRECKVSTKKKKASVSKEDLESKTFREAYLQEYKRWFETNAVCELNESDVNVYNIVPCASLKSWKEKDGEKVGKVRVIALGNQDRRLAETYASTPDQGVMFFMIFLCLSLGFDMGIGDVSTAFLNAPLNLSERVYLKLPNDIPSYVTKQYPLFERGRVVRVLKSVYGLRYSPCQYQNWFRDKLKSLNYVEIAPCLYAYIKDKKVEALLTVHVDDGILGVSMNGKREGIETEFERLRKSGIPFGECQNLRDKDRKFLGMCIRKTEADTVSIDTHKYMENVIASMSGENLSIAKRKRIGKGEFVLHESDVDGGVADLSDEYREFLGKLGWGVKASPAYAYVFSFLSQFANCPPVRIFHLLLRSINYMVERPNSVCLQSIENFKLRFWSDASYQRKNRTGHLGYVVQAVSANSCVSELREKDWRNVIEVKSKKTPCTIRSSTSAELHALEECIINSFKYFNICKKLGLNIEFEFVIDSDSLNAQINRKWIQSEYELQSQLDFVLEKLETLRAPVYLIDTAYMMADDLTKFIPLCITK